MKGQIVHDAAVLPLASGAAQTAAPDKAYLPQALAGTCYVHVGSMCFYSPLIKDLILFCFWLPCSSFLFFNLIAFFF